jgi:hypothetical protein
MQICRKCLRIKLNGFRPVYTLVDITSNILYKCTETFRTPCIKQIKFRLEKFNLPSSVVSPNHELL